MLSIWVPHMNVSFITRTELFLLHIGRLAAAGTEDLLVEKIKRKIAGKDFFPIKIGYFPRLKKHHFFVVFWSLHLSSIVMWRSGLIIPVT